MSELSVKDLEAVLADREARILKMREQLELSKADLLKSMKEIARLKGLLKGLGLE